MLPDSRFEKADYVNGTRPEAKGGSEKTPVIGINHDKYALSGTYYAKHSRKVFPKGVQVDGMAAESPITGDKNHAATDASAECGTRDVATGPGQAHAGHTTCRTGATELQ
ncbi:hypothetical protein PSCICJ_10320 [Pseudomonas cichorii]|nr:hypothetical protein PSCICJ_10320 [Pseudomonas cichorii]